MTITRRIVRKLSVAGGRRPRMSRRASHDISATTPTATATSAKRNAWSIVLPARTGRPAGGRKGERPDGRPDHREHHVPASGAREDAGGDGDERADDGRDASEQHRPVAPAREPRLGAIELRRIEVEPRPRRSSNGRPPRRPISQPSQRADRVSDRAGEGDREIGGETGRELVTEQCHRLTGQRARGHGAAVEHHELARGGKHGVDHHQREHRVEAVVADQVRQRRRKRADVHRCTLKGC